MNDASYKRLLTHRRIVEDLLVGFIAPRRPAGWADALDFESLREGPTENVGDDLSRSFDDVVWSIDRRAADGSVETVHVLIEHQSSVDYAMPLRFLNYTNLLYRRRYRDHRWRKGDTVEPVLRVVLYNGDARWDAARSLTELTPRCEYDGPPELALSYEVVDLVGMEADDLPRPNLIAWMAEVERSRRAGVLAERVRELGQWLAAEDEPELTRSFDLWLSALGRKWGVELPSIRDYEEASAMLLEKIDRWEAEILERGVQEGRLKGRQEGELKGRQEGELKGRQEGRQEGELKGRQEGRMETIDGLLRAGIGWPVIQSATGIDEQTWRALKRDSANGTEQAPP